MPKILNLIYNNIAEKRLFKQKSLQPISVAIGSNAFFFN